MSIYAILEELASTSSSNTKKEILARHKDNETLKRVLVMALSPYMQFYIRQIPEYTPASRIHDMSVEGSAGASLERAMDSLLMLHRREFTGHAAAAHLKFILESVSEDDAKVIERIIEKDLKCGVAEGTVNKVWKGLVPKYPVLLGHPYEEKNRLKFEKHISFPAFGQIKADGVRVNIHVDLKEQKVTYLTRKGRYIELYGIHDRYFLGLAQHVGVDCVFDGECLVHDPETGKVMPRKKGNGIINKAIKGTISEAEARLVHFQLWDVVPMEAFHKRKFTVPYHERLKRLESAVEAAAVTRDVKPYKVIETRLVDDWDAVQEYFEESLRRGEEGIMLKGQNHPWEDARTYNLIKFKAERDCDLRIVGYNPGKGKFAGMVGSIIAESSDGKVSVAVSGMDDETREFVTENSEALLNSIVTVRYNERIKSKDREDVDSLFLPRIIEFRQDKTEADSSGDIK